MIRDENGKDVTPRSLLEPCRWTRKKNEVFRGDGGGKEEEEEEEEEEESFFDASEDEESTSNSNEDEEENSRVEGNDNDIDSIFNFDFSKLWERQSSRESKRIELAPIEFATPPTATRRRKKTRIKKKRVPFDPEIHVNRSTQTYTTPCVVRETFTDSPETKESETCWQKEETRKEGGKAPGRARKRVGRAFLKQAEIIADRQIRASLMLEQTLRYRGALHDGDELPFDASKQLTRLCEYKYPSASSSESGKEKRVNAIRFHPRFDGVVAICHGSVDAGNIVLRGDDYDENVDENKRNLEYFNKRDLEKRGAVHVWTLRDATKPEVSLTLESSVTSIAFQSVHYNDAEEHLRNKSRHMLCGCLDGSIRCLDIAFRGDKKGSASHQHQGLLYESRPEHSHKEKVWAVEFLDDNVDKESHCEFSAVSCSTDGAILKMDARALIPSESIGTLRILRDGQDRGEKRFLESSGETILGKSLVCDDPREIQATCLDVIDQSCLLVGTIRGDIFVCAKRSLDENDGHSEMFTITKKIKAHSISSLYAAIYQVKKHPSVPGVFATASADGTVRVFRVSDLEHEANSVKRARDTHANNANDLWQETSSSIFKETDASQIFSFAPVPLRVQHGYGASSSSSSSSRSTASSVSLPPVNDIAWDTNDGRKLAAVYDDGTLRIWKCERAVAQKGSNIKSDNARNDASLTVTTPWFEEKFDEIGIQQKKSKERGETNEKKNAIRLTAVSYSNTNASPILAVGDNLGSVHLFSVAAAQNEEERQELKTEIDHVFSLPDYHSR